MSLPPDADRIIRRAAIAERRYWRMVRRASENPQLKRELMERRVVVNAELRGEKHAYMRLPPLPADVNLSLDDAVARELRAMRPLVEVEVMARRERKRDAGCGLAQMALSYAARARKALRTMLAESGVTIYDLAFAFGVSSSTLERHLRGDTIGKTRELWYNNLKRIFIDDDGFHIVVQFAPHKRIRRRGRRRRRDYWYVDPFDDVARTG